MPTLKDLKALDYSMCHSLFHNGRVKRQLCNNTWLFKLDSLSPPVYDVVYYRTAIMRLSPTQVHVNTGGYHTVTTIRRINLLLPVGWKLASFKGELKWLVRFGSAGHFTVQDYKDWDYFERDEDGIWRFGGWDFKEECRKVIRINKQLKGKEHGQIANV